MLPRADRLIAIEIDAVLAASLPGAPNLEVVHAGVLETDLAQWGPAVVAGNLPYYLTSPILHKTLSLGLLLLRAVFLVQREVAARLVAAPGSRDYGFLSVRTQVLAEPSILFSVPPSAFQPPPKVDSAVVRLDPHAKAAELGIADIEDFLEFLSRSFRQKRKTLRNNLAPYYEGVNPDDFPEVALRAEQTSLETLARLYRRLVT